MTDCLTDGCTLTCPLGSKTGTLSVTAGQPPLQLAGKAVATGTVVPAPGAFGTCATLQGPCAPAGSWVIGAASLTIGKVPVLRTNDQFICAVGGVVTPAMNVTGKLVAKS